MTKRHTLVGITMAINNMKEMLEFYSNVFDITFEKRPMFGSELYFGQWNDIQLVFCPAVIAQNTATQNKHQLDIEVHDLQAVIGDIEKHGGQVMGNIVSDKRSESVGIYDPDGNSILFKQPL